MILRDIELRAIGLQRYGSGGRGFAKKRPANRQAFLTHRIDYKIYVIRRNPS